MYSYHQHIFNAGNNSGFELKDSYLNATFSFFWDKINREEKEEIRSRISAGKNNTPNPLSDYLKEIEGFEYVNTKAIPILSLTPIVDQSIFKKKRYIVKNNKTAF